MEKCLITALARKYRYVRPYIESVFLFASKNATIRETSIKPQSHSPCPNRVEQKVQENILKWSVRIHWGQIKHYFHRYLAFWCKAMNESYLPPPPGILSPEVLNVHHRLASHQGLSGVYGLKEKQSQCHNRSVQVFGFPQFINHQVKNLKSDCL